MRKLLLHRHEIRKLTGQIAQKGYTIVPVEVYFPGGLVKLKIALAKGKKLHDKRDAARDRDAAREIDKALKERNR